MKFFVLAALFVALLTPNVHADEKPRVRVQITYLDTGMTDQVQSKLMAAPRLSTGNALADFTRTVKSWKVPYKVTRGPVITSPVGVFSPLDRRHVILGARVEDKYVDLNLGPRFAVMPALVKPNLVSITIHLHDQEIVGPDGYWFDAPELVNAATAPSFQAHSGSTIYIGGSYSSLKIGRFTFATVTLLPLKPIKTAKAWYAQSVLSATGPPVPQKPAAKPVFTVHMGIGEARPNSSAVFIAIKDPDIPVVTMEMTTIAVPSDLVGPVTEAMSDPANRKRRLHLLAEDAMTQGETCVVTRHARAFENAGVSPVTRSHWSVPVSDSLFIYPGQTKNSVTVRRKLTVDVTPQWNPNGIVTVRFHVWKNQSAVRVPHSPLIAPGSVWGQSQVLYFRSGETKALAIHYPADDIQHLVFTTVTVSPPGK